MTRIVRRVALIATSALGAVVGVWAFAFPHSFYDAFPGLGLAWVSIDGPFNEHLIGDVGAFYLALTAVTVWVIFNLEPGAVRLVGILWTVFGVVHFSYHATHLAGMSAHSATAELVALGISLLLGVVLILPPRIRSTVTPPLPSKETQQ